MVIFHSYVSLPEGTKREAVFGSAVHGKSPMSWQMVFVAPASAAVSASAPAPAEPQPAPQEPGRAWTLLKMLKVTICQPGFEMLEFPKWLRQNSFPIPTNITNH